MKKMLNGLCIATLCLLTVSQGVHAATNSAVKSNSAHEHSQGSIKDSELNNEEIKRQYQQVISTYVEREKSLQGIYSLQTKYLPTKTFQYLIKLNGEKVYSGLAEDIRDIKFEPSVKNEFRITVTNMNGTIISQKTETWLPELKAFQIIDSKRIDDLSTNFQIKNEKSEKKADVKKEESKKASLGMLKKEDIKLGQKESVLKDQWNGVISQLETKIHGVWKGLLGYGK
ncbi:hypothetical protein P9597_10850 [Aneurinibacillus migulanus]|uniref:hypothetical protein n=1 Tax=Aneurinibacillus migulanus TaxID=47500 RepID=UPI002E1CDAA2|nr:hypothetical protein [Aneurinibacillus migulanus]